MNFSIVIPARDAAGTLPECLRAISVLHGKEKIAGVIVVDDGSADDTGKIAAERGCKVVRSERPGGPAVARNRGANESTGEVLLFVDADIVLPGNAIVEFENYLNVNPDIAAVRIGVFEMQEYRVIPLCSLASIVGEFECQPNSVTRPHFGGRELSGY